MKYHSTLATFSNGIISLMECTSWSTLMRLLTTGILHVPHSLHPNLLLALFSTYVAEIIFKWIPFFLLVLKKREKCYWVLMFTVLRWVGQLRSTALQESCRGEEFSPIHRYHHKVSSWSSSSIPSLSYLEFFIVIIGHHPNNHTQRHKITALIWHRNLTCAFNRELWNDEPSRLEPSRPKMDCILIICNTLFWGFPSGLSFSYTTTSGTNRPR